VPPGCQIWLYDARDTAHWTRDGHWDIRHDGHWFQPAAHYQNDGSSFLGHDIRNAGREEGWRFAGNNADAAHYPFSRDMPPAERGLFLFPPDLAHGLPHPAHGTFVPDHGGHHWQPAGHERPDGLIDPWAREPHTHHGDHTPAPAAVPDAGARHHHAEHAIARPEDQALAAALSDDHTGAASVLPHGQDQALAAALSDDHTGAGAVIQHAANAAGSQLYDYTSYTGTDV